MPPTLIGLAYTDNARPKNVPTLDYVDLTIPNHPLAGWRVLVRGSQVVLVSPPGWTPTRTRPNEAQKDGQRTHVQIARSRVTLYWSGAEDEAVPENYTWPAPVKAEGKGKA